MKCSICGHRANSLPAMGKHYRKKHPSRMKRKAKSAKVSGSIKSDKLSRLEQILKLIGD